MNEGLGRFSRPTEGRRTTGAGFPTFPQRNHEISKTFTTSNVDPDLFKKINKQLVKEEGHNFYRVTDHHNGHATITVIGNTKYNVDEQARNVMLTIKVLLFEGRKANNEFTISTENRDVRKVAGPWYKDLSEIRNNIMGSDVQSDVARNQPQLPRPRRGQWLLQRKLDDVNMRMRNRLLDETKRAELDIKRRSLEASLNSISDRGDTIPQQPEQMNPGQAPQSSTTIASAAEPQDDHTMDAPMDSNGGGIW